MSTVERWPRCPRDPNWPSPLRPSQGSPRSRRSAGRGCSRRRRPRRCSVPARGHGDVLEDHETARRPPPGDPRSHEVDVAADAGTHQGEQRRWRRGGRAGRPGARLAGAAGVVALAGAHGDVAPACGSRARRRWLRPDLGQGAVAAVIVFETVPRTVAAMWRPGAVRPLALPRMRRITRRLSAADARPAPPRTRRKLEPFERRAVSARSGDLSAETLAEKVPRDLARLVRGARQADGALARIHDRAVRLGAPPSAAPRRPLIPGTARLANADPAGTLRTPCRSSPPR